jgi:hypothetical protein
MKDLREKRGESGCSLSLGIADLGPANSDPILRLERRDVVARRAVKGQLRHNEGPRRRTARLVGRLLSFVHNKQPSGKKPLRCNSERDSLSVTTNHALQHAANRDQTRQKV